MKSFYCSDQIREQIEELKKTFKNDKKAKKAQTDEKSEPVEKEHDNEMVQQYLSEQRKYSSLKKDVPKKGDAR